MTNENNNSDRTKGLVSLCFILVLVACIVFLSQYDPAQEVMKSVIAYIDKNKVVGSFIFVGIFGLLTCFMVPITIPMLISGVVFKPVPLAIMLTISFSMLAICLAFLAGKTFLRPFITSVVKGSPKFRAIDQAVKREGWKVVVMLRFTPIIPLGVANYLLSSTGIALTTVLWSTMLGCLPSFIAFPIIGSFMASVEEVDAEVSMPFKVKVALIVILVGVCLMSSLFFGMMGRNAIHSTVGNGNNRPSSTVEESIGNCDIPIEDDDLPRKPVTLSRRDKLILWSVFSFILVSWAVSLPLIFIFMHK